MNISAAPVLLLGLGARVGLDFFTRSGEPTFHDHILLGLWQGVALWYAVREKTDFVLPVAIGVGTKLLIEFVIVQNISRLAITVIGIFVGAIATEVISSFVDPDPQDKRSKRGRGSSRSNTKPSRSHRTRDEEDDLVETASRRSRAAVSDITSVDTSSFGSRSSAMTPLEREIATLRTRASLADSERRRFKEERKWAKESGNTELSDQLKWQIKKYTALMKSFHHEADSKVVEVSRTSTRMPVIVTSASSARQQAAADSSRVPVVVRRSVSHAPPANRTSQRLAAITETAPTLNVVVSTSKPRTRRRSLSVGIEQAQATSRVRVR